MHGFFNSFALETKTNPLYYEEIMTDIYSSINEEEVDNFSDNDELSSESETSEDSVHNYLNDSEPESSDNAMSIGNLESEINNLILEYFHCSEEHINTLTDKYFNQEFPYINDSFF
jgi:hypothetical protein